MSRDIPCSERVRQHWERPLEDLQRFYDAACCNGVFDESDSDYDDATIDADLDSQHHWVVYGAGDHIGTFSSMADAEAAQREFRIEKGLDPETGERPDRDAVLDEFNEYALSFDYVAPHTFKDQDRGYWRYQISWGGPSDEIRFYGDFISEYRCELNYAEYWFMDWFDGASIDVRGEVVRWLWAEFNDTGTAGHTYQKAMEDYEPPMDDDDEENDDE